MVWARECDGQLARFRALEVQVHEQVVGRIQAHHGVHARAVHGDLGIADAGSIDHQLQRRVLHPCVPVCGVDAGDLYGAVAFVGEGAGVLAAARRQQAERAGESGDSSVQFHIGM